MANTLPNEPAACTSRIDDAVEAIARGRMVIVVDDPGRENEGDFVMAAQHATPQAVNFMMTHGRGLLCLPVTAERADALDLRLLASRGGGRDTAFTVSIDLATGGSGISAPDRSACVRRVADPDARASDFCRPGHVFPIRARDGGVLERRGHTEAAIDLARLARLHPSGLICEIMNDDGTMARLPDLVRLARRFGMPLVSVSDLVAYRRRHEPLVRRSAQTPLATAFGTFTAVSYDAEGAEHLALVHGDPANLDGALVAIHTECLVGDALGGLGCACGARLRDAMRRVTSVRSGVIVYLRSPLAHAEPDMLTASRILEDLGLTRLRVAGEDAGLARALHAQGLAVIRDANVVRAEVRPVATIA